MIDDGLYLLRTIGANRSTKTTDPWIARYIFPNGMLPSPSQIAAAIEGVFVLEKWDNWGLDYEMTLVQWCRKTDEPAAGIIAVDRWRLTRDRQGDPSAQRIVLVKDGAGAGGFPDYLIRTFARTRTSLALAERGVFKGDRPRYTVVYLDKPFYRIVLICSAVAVAIRSGNPAVQFVVVEDHCLTLAVDNAREVSTRIVSIG